jgi:hypothetical protein
MTVHGAASEINTLRLDARLEVAVVRDLLHQTRPRAGAPQWNYAPRSNFFQRWNVNDSLRLRKLAKLMRQYSQRNRIAPREIFRPMKKGGSNVLPVHPFRSIRKHFGHRA